jgi:hypothetical protein
MHSELSFDMLFVRNGAQTAENEPDYYRVMELLLQRILHRKRTGGSALLHIYSAGQKFEQPKGVGQLR